MYFVVYYSYLETDTLFNIKASNLEELDYMIKYVKKTLNAKIEFIKVKEL